MHEQAMPPKSDFAIHVDSSCLTDSTDLKIPSNRNTSDQTVIHNEVESLHSDNEESQVGSELSRDEQTEALIHAAARAVVASIEKDVYDQGDSTVSSGTEEGYDGETELTYEDGSELTYGDGTELTYDSEDHHNQDPYDGSASSHHEDDVFSHGNARSNRSSLNSSTDEEDNMKHHDEFECGDQLLLEQGKEHEPAISRLPSTTSRDFALLPEPLTLASSPAPHTPSRVRCRPAFRTPSSVRAMQMSSPTQSIFSRSPRSSKRPTASRLGTPQAENLSSAETKTPTRFKIKKEYPLVLLHVTVLPLHWPCGDAMDDMSPEELPRELQGVRESWKLLQEKLGEMVLERGILLPHPQDSYELLEERLLEALELPVRPRAKILSCGHYVGPNDEDSSYEDDSECEDETKVTVNREQWCDICESEVMYQDLGIGGKQKRFRVKVYASNGLMRAGAWAAAWREMERVDVEIEPFIPPHLASAMGSLMAFHAQRALPHGQDDRGAEHEPQHHQDDEVKYAEHEETARRRQMEEERIREIYGHHPPPPPPPEVRQGKRPYSSPIHRKEYGDSLPELLLEAVKVLMRDKKHIAIGILSILVVILALRPSVAANHVLGNDEVSAAPVIGIGQATNDWSLVPDKVDVASQKHSDVVEQNTDAIKTYVEEPLVIAQTQPHQPASISQEISAASVEQEKHSHKDELPPDTEYSVLDDAQPAGIGTESGNESSATAAVGIARQEGSG